MRKRHGTRKLTIVVSSMIADVPCQGGLTWVVLQYLLGFQRLGHDVYFVEEVPASSLDPIGCPIERTANAAYFREVFSAFELEAHASVVVSESRQSIGLSYESVVELARRADVLINIGGMLRDEQITSHIPLRVYLDVDPLFTQYWNQVDQIDMGMDGHTHYATVGLNLGEPHSRIPSCGKQWLTMVPPVVLSHWPEAVCADNGSITTVANWRGYGSVEHDGVFYGQKVHSWRKFMELPVITQQDFTVALAIHPGEIRDLQQLELNQWRIVDPGEVARSPESYQWFIRRSKAEIGIAKDGYVVGRSGWFSDRSVCYLASGRPVIAQETGFSDYLPTGKGLLTFDTLEEAVECVHAVNRDYAQHSTTARRVAKEHLDSDIVLERLLRQIGAI